MALLFDLEELAKENPRIHLSEDKTKVELNHEQSLEILKKWNEATLNPPSIDDLQAAAYGKIYDSRSKPALAIKKFLAERQLKFKSKSDVLVEKIVLTDEQKEYVLNHSEGPNAEKPVEMAKLLFNNDKITPIHPETLVINEYLISIRGSKETIQDNTDKETKKYLPPRRIEQAAARVNVSVFKDTIKDKCWESNITIKKCLESLIKFCHYPRFVLLCNKYFEMEERNLFEGTYIAYVWDKVDLTAEELDLYIDVCQDVISELRLNAELGHWTHMMETGATDDDGKKISSMVIGEHLANLRDESNKNKERRKKAIENLQGKRSTRIENKLKQTASMLNLVEAWKNKESRDKIVKDAEERKKRVGEEIKKLTAMESLKALIAGVHPEEILR